MLTVVTFCWQGRHGSLSMATSSTVQDRRGERHPRAKLTAEQVLDLRLAWARGEPQTSIARRLNVSQSTISRIVRGKRWTHLKS